jgi:cell division protein FtsB
MSHFPQRIGVVCAVSLYAGLAAYCCLSSLAGPVGTLAYARLDARRQDMIRNLESLSRDNEYLWSELDSLRSDSDRAEREARSLGYLRKDEGEIVLAGDQNRLRSLVTGELVPFVPPKALPDMVLKEISLGIALAAMALGFAPRRRLPGQR